MNATTLIFYAANPTQHSSDSTPDYLGSIDLEDIAALNRLKLVNSNSDNQLPLCAEQFFDIASVASKFKVATNRYDAIQNSTCIRSESAERYIEILKTASLKQTGLKIVAQE